MQSRKWETEDATKQIPRKVYVYAKDKVTKLWQSFTYSVPQQCQREQRWRWHGWDMWHAWSESTKKYGQRIRRKDAFCIPMNHEGIEQMHGLSQTKYKEAAATVNTIAQLVSTGLWIATHMNSPTTAALWNPVVRYEIRYTTPYCCRGCRPSTDTISLSQCFVTLAPCKRATCSVLTSGGRTKWQEIIPGNFQE
jgi:hypothetical protein